MQKKRNRFFKRSILLKRNRFFLSLSKNSENTDSSIRDSLNRDNPMCHPPHSSCCAPKWMLPMLLIGLGLALP